MSSRYEIWLCNDNGTRIADVYGHLMLERAINFTATRVANDIGTFTVSVPSTFDQSLLRRDLIIQLWRAAEGASLELFRMYFLRRWILETRGGYTSIELHGRDTNDLLRRRVVNAPPGAPNATKGGHAAWNSTAEDILKEIVREQQIDLGGGSYWPPPSYGTRAWPNLSVEGASWAGPKIDFIDISYEYLLQSGSRGAMIDIANSAREEGTEIFFDIVPHVLTGKQVTFIFRTTVGQPGQDITTHGVLFSQDRGNLTDCSLTYDYTSEENMIWAVRERGPYDTSVDQINSKEDMDASIWNRCEGLVDKSTVDRASYLTYMKGQAGRVSFIGTITDTSGMRYGVDWDFGDRVKVRYLNFQFEAIVRAVTVQVDKDGSETVSARLEYQEDA